MDTQTLAKLGMVAFLLASVPLGFLYGKFLPPISGKKLRAFLISIFVVLAIGTVASYFTSKSLNDKPPKAMQLWLTPCFLANAHLTALLVAKRKRASQTIPT